MSLLAHGFQAAKDALRSIDIFKFHHVIGKEEEPATKSMVLQIKKLEAFLNDLVYPHFKGLSEGAYNAAMEAFRASLVIQARQSFYPKVDDETAKSILAKEAAFSDSLVILATGLEKTDDIPVIDYQLKLDAARRAALRHSLITRELQPISELMDIGDVIDDSKYYEATSHLILAIKTLLDFKRGYDNDFPAKAGTASLLDVEGPADRITSEADLFVVGKCRDLATRSTALVTTVTRVMKHYLPEADHKRGYEEWVVNTPDLPKIEKLCNDPKVVGLGHTVKKAEDMITRVEQFHTAAPDPTLVLWQNKEAAKDGALESARKVFHECKLLLCVATAAKMVHFRSKQEWECPKAKKKAVSRVKALITSDSMNCQKDRVLCFCCLWLCIVNVVMLFM